MSAIVENEISEEHLKQFNHPWEWVKISDEMIDLIFNEYYLQNHFVDKLKVILRNILENIHILHNYNADSSYLFQSLFELYDNLIYVKSKCAIYCSTQLSEFEQLLEDLRYNFATIDVTNLKYSQQLQIHVNKILDDIQTHLDKLKVK